MDDERAKRQELNEREEFSFNEDIVRGYYFWNSFSFYLLANNPLMDVSTYGLARLYLSIFFFMSSHRMLERLLSPNKIRGYCTGF